MTKLIDYSAMPKRDFWALVNSTGEAAGETFKKYWDAVSERALSQDEAIECLNALFIESHCRIQEHSSALAREYPTRQHTKNRLEKQAHLYFVDHFTAGISKWSTLNWFSSAKRKKKNGKTGLAGASTHFIQGYHGAPFYIIPLMHAAWHEPRRNRDSIGVETVNAGRLHRDKAGKWCYWARELPMDLVLELPPVLLDKPYRGNKVMQPFTREQLINNIKLKRLLIAALPDKMDASRMSQHTDWRTGKSDMGPLFPFEACNGAAYSPEPILELDFIQNEGYSDLLDEQGTSWDEISGWETHDETENPSYGEAVPTHDDDPDDDKKEVYSVKNVQEKLVQKGYPLLEDGVMGPITRNAVKKFQQEWNKRNPIDRLKVDGMPGPQTCNRLFR